jgi:transmembrane 9 superfamily protein 3
VTACFHTVVSWVDLALIGNLNSDAVCSAYNLNAKQVNLFRYAVANNYWFQMFLDDLPIGGMANTLSVDEGLQDVDLLCFRICRRG